jgi:hypothetical protein
MGPFENFSVAAIVELGSKIKHAPFWIILTTLVGGLAAMVALVSNLHTVVGWFSAPKPRFQGVVTLGLSDSEGFGNLKYRLNVSLSNIGDSIGAHGGLLLLRADTLNNSSVAVAVERILIDSPGVRRAMPVGGGIVSAALPNQLIACIWIESEPAKPFPIYFRLADEDTKDSDFSGLFAGPRISYAHWTILPKVPDAGPLTEPSTCETAVRKALTEKLQEKGIVDLSATYDKKNQPPMIRGEPETSYRPGDFWTRLATWDVRVDFAQNVSPSRYASRGEYSLDQVAWFAAAKSVSKTMNSQNLEVHSAAGSKWLWMRYPSPDPLEFKFSINFAEVARRSLKERLLSNADWLRCHAYIQGDCEYLLLADTYPALRSISYGSSPNDLTKSIILEVPDKVLNTTYREQACINGLEPLRIEPQWDTVYLQLKFFDESMSDVRPFSVPPIPNAIQTPVAKPRDRCAFTYTKTP